MKIFIFGGSGLVGSKFIDLHSQNFEINAPEVSIVDILNKDQVSRVIEQFNPDTIINFAAYTQVEEAENQKGDKEGTCYLINVVGAKNVAEVCKSFDKKLIHISTDYVFDGTKSKSPYVEEDNPNPINWYGQTKYFGEQFVLESECPSIIIRLCMPFSAFYEVKLDIARFFLNQLKNGSEINAIEDQRITPTYVDDIAAALQVVVNKGIKGIYHVCSTNNTTPFEFAKLIANTFELNTSLVKPVSFDEYNEKKKAKLLKNSWLSSAKFRKELGEGILHTIEESITLFKSLQPDS